MQEKMILKLHIAAYAATLSIPFAAAMLFGVHANAETQNGWEITDEGSFWYVDGVKQGTEGRGTEIHDPDSDAWYWLDAVDGGKKAVSKDVYQESEAGQWAEKEDGTGKWVRYDEEGHMVKGWNLNENGTYYFDPQYGTMAKGVVVIDGKEYAFSEVTGTLIADCRWVEIEGKTYWYENGIRQGLEGRGKEIYDPGSYAWYWLDSDNGGQKAVNKEVYQESEAGKWAEREDGTGKWVRYDENGHMVKGWDVQDNERYYFDPVYGTMAKGFVVIDAHQCDFDETSGIFAGYYGEEGGLQWRLYKGRLTVTGNIDEGQEVDWQRIWKGLQSEVTSAYMDFTGATSLDHLFASLGDSPYSGYYNLQSVDLSELDMSNVTSMDFMFYNCIGLQNLDLNGLDTSNVKSMNCMFYNCTNLQNIALNEFDTSNVTSMRSMFYNCPSLRNIDLTGFDTKNVTDMSYMFYGSGLTELDLSHFNTGNVYNMYMMFANCTHLTNIKLDHFDTGSTYAMYAMFQGCSSLTSLDLSSFNTRGMRAAVGMSNLFDGCTHLTEILVGPDWVVSEVATDLFRECGTDHVTLKK